MTLSAGRPGQRHHVLDRRRRVEPERDRCLWLQIVEDRLLHHLQGCARQLVGRQLDHERSAHRNARGELEPGQVHPVEAAAVRTEVGHAVRGPDPDRGQVDRLAGRGDDGIHDDEAGRGVARLRGARDLQRASDPDPFDGQVEPRSLDRATDDSVHRHGFLDVLLRRGEAVETDDRDQDRERQRHVDRLAPAHFVLSLTATVLSAAISPGSHFSWWSSSDCSWWSYACTVSSTDAGNSVALGNFHT